jgi:hypothetical protein
MKRVVSVDDHSILRQGVIIPDSINYCIQIKLSL